jgi:hypothetical protein
MQIHYARMSEHYNTLADAELIGGLAYEHSLAEDEIGSASLNERYDVTRRRRLAGRAGAQGAGAAGVECARRARAATRHSTRSTEDQTVPPTPAGHPTGSRRQAKPQIIEMRRAVLAD